MLMLHGDGLLRIATQPSSSSSSSSSLAASTPIADN